MYRDCTRVCIVLGQHVTCNTKDLCLRYDDNLYFYNKSKFFGAEPTDVSEVIYSLALVVQKVGCVALTSQGGQIENI